VAVVTLPFTFEGSRRMRQAEKGLAELASSVDTVITLPNDRLLSLAPKGTSFFDAFRMADDVLRQAVQGISDIITTPGLINRDFSDIRAIMLGMGFAMMGTATAEGESAAIDAAKKAIRSPLLDEAGITGARGILINITGSSKLGLHEVNEACSLIREAAQCEEVQINFGVVLNEAMKNAVKITVIATGFPREDITIEERKPTRRPAAPEPPPEQQQYPLMADDPAPSAPEPPAPAPAPDVAATPDSMDEDDLDKPAYLRRGRMLQ